MKTILTTSIMVIAFIFQINAQRPNKEKIKALKIAHITEQLDLTEKEAQAFWPIYNANEEEREKLHEARPRKERRRHLDNLSEEEAKKQLDALLTMEENKVALLKTYYNKLLKVLPPKKIMILLEADRSFKRKMIEHFKMRHKDRLHDKK